MSLNKNLSVTLTNDKEGISLVLKTVSVRDNGVVVTGDPGLYNLEELKEAIAELEKFIHGN